ncbi:hypothetical protein HMPREF0202_00204 [Cetobacterium somerae ATCC BAA-474]|uniref:UspA domain-containing protein n=1 Tax=Cetobacterium somerae ATCC BAA-474 TaxID=1319815 RepID=U7VFI5_9FUSO|nr:hypothetical protein [Cetobacterium somerae]ERT69894.1 hypothetical protein HMPREF0202_00204 [Cetobacterium somerae ATCC BAA-474]
MNKFIVSDSFKSSFEKAIHYSITNYDNITIAVELLDQVDGIISDVLGMDITNSLKKKKVIQVQYENQKKILNLISFKSKNNNIQTSQIIIASFITFQYLENLMLQYPKIDFIYIPWLPEEKIKISTYKNFSLLN